MLEAHVRALEAKYREAERSETRWETWKVDDADVVLVGYGIVARVLRAVAEAARRRGIRVGAAAPDHPLPIPDPRRSAPWPVTARTFAVVEMSTGPARRGRPAGAGGPEPGGVLRPGGRQHPDRRGGAPVRGEDPGRRAGTRGGGRRWPLIPRRWRSSTDARRPSMRRFDRKDDDQHQTHYCPGCGHGIVTKLLADAIDKLGIQDRTILVSPVGCSVFGYEYLDVGNIQAAHGRAPAVATAVKRSLPESIVVSYQGDGDLAAIGTAEIVHAANRGENLTVIFVNNAIYGMTGGQMAPTTLLGERTTTTPLGRDPAEQGYPIKVCELLATLDAPVLLERVALGSNKQIMATGRVIRRALENQIQGLGFSLVEVLAPCPTGLGPGSRRGPDLRARHDDTHLPARELPRPLRERGPAASHLARARSRGAAGHPRPGPRARGRRFGRHGRVRPSGPDRRPPDGGGGVRRAGRAAARGVPRRGRAERGVPRLLAAVLWTADALGDVELSRPHLRGARRLAALLPSHRAGRAQRAITAQVPAVGGSGRAGPLQRRARAGGLRGGRRPDHPDRQHRHRRSPGVGEGRQHGDAGSPARGLRACSRRRRSIARCTGW